MTLQISIPAFWYKHTQQHSRNRELAYVSCCISRLVAPVSWFVIGCYFFIPVLDRGLAEIHVPVTHSLWASHFSSFGCSTFHDLSPLSLYLLCSGHTPTHRDTHKHWWWKHTYEHTHSRHRDPNANREPRCFSSWRSIWNVEIPIFLIRTFPVVQMWNREKSNFHVGGLTPRSCYRKYREFHTSVQKFIVLKCIREIQRIPYFMNKQWGPDFHLWNRDNSNSTLFLHILRKPMPRLSYVNYKDCVFNVRKSPSWLSYMRYREFHISYQLTSIQIFMWEKIIQCITE